MNHSCRVLATSGHDRLAFPCWLARGTSGNSVCSQTSWRRLCKTKPVWNTYRHVAPTLLLCIYMSWAVVFPCSRNKGWETFFQLDSHFTLPGRVLKCSAVIILFSHLRQSFWLIMDLRGSDRIMWYNYCIQCRKIAL